MVVLLFYLVVGVLVIIVMNVLGEMVVVKLISGVFLVYVVDVMGVIVGVMVGWLWWV